MMQKQQQKTPESMRLDKWLWCARLFKTRQLATQAIKSGRVKQDGKWVKPSKMILPGENYSVRRGAFTRTITVTGLAMQRRSAAEASALYHETRESIEAREKLQQQLKVNNALLPRSRGRPTKRDRRKLINFKYGSEE